MAVSLCLSAQSNATDSQIKNQHTNEKIIITDCASTPFVITNLYELQSESYSFVAEHCEYNTINIGASRYSDNARYDIPVQRGYFENYSAGNYGQHRLYKYAGNSNRIATDKNVSIYNKGENESGLYLQGFGNKVPASGEKNYRIAIGKPTELSYFGCKRNKGSSICAKVDKGFSLDRRRVYIGCNHLAGV